MSVVLILAFLFCVGSLLGWVIELLYRNIYISIKSDKKDGWINPGFCMGPYLPLYGFGLCILYLLATAEMQSPLNNTAVGKIVFFILMAICMTVIEYIAGIILLKFYNVKLWDYSDNWANIHGIVCPKYSVFWTLLGAVYYFLVHSHILNALSWLSSNLAFSFFIGIFFGVFIIDVVNSLQLIDKLKKFTSENQIIVQYENLKRDIKNYHKQTKQKYHFFRPFLTDKPLKEHLAEMYKNIEQHSKKKK